MTTKTPDVKVQCLATDFFVGDGRILYGPRVDDEGNKIKGDIDTIPAELATLGEERDQLRILG